MAKIQKNEGKCKFRGLKIYFHGVKIYFQALKIVFHVVKIVFLKRFGIKTNEFVLFFTQLFVTLPIKSANLLRLGKKKNKFFCFALDFS